jgi:hypothetical protein
MALDTTGRLVCVTNAFRLREALADIIDTLSQIIYSTGDGFILNASRRGHG